MAGKTATKKRGIKGGSPGYRNPPHSPETQLKPGHKLSVGHGRPRKIYAQFPGYKPSEINETYMALLQLDESELEKIHKSKKVGEYTALEKVVASSIRKSIATGRMAEIEALITRSFGFPKAEVSHNIKSEQPLFPE